MVLILLVFPSSGLLHFFSGQLPQFVSFLTPLFFTAQHASLLRNAKWVYPGLYSLRNQGCILSGIRAVFSQASGLYSLRHQSCILSGIRIQGCILSGIRAAISACHIYHICHICHIYHTCRFSSTWNMCHNPICRICRICQFKILDLFVPR